MVNVIPYPTRCLLQEGRVLLRYLRLGGPPGLIHWKTVAAWLKNQRFNQMEAYVDIQS